MTHSFFFRWPNKTAEEEATKKTAVSVTNSTINLGLGAWRTQPFFVLKRDL